MKFQTFHKDFFGAIKGAYSLVTQRENYDSQITLTDFEAELVINHFGLENIHIGNVGSDPQKSSKTFLRYSDTREIKLNLVFPKPEKTELRLYLSERSGFKPDGGRVWFIYEDVNQNLVLGDLSETEWRSLGQSDEEDLQYQEDISDLLITPPSLLDVNIEGVIMTREIGAKTTYVRDPKLAALRLQLSDYTCEINPEHTTFIAEKSKKPYVEAHHFVPMKFQHHFETPLDNLHNIISLCPNCHRGFHHAIADHKLNLIQNIYTRRPEINDQFSFEQIAQFYNSLRIEPR